MATFLGNFGKLDHFFIWHLVTLVVSKVQLRPKQLLQRTNSMKNVNDISYLYLGALFQHSYTTPKFIYDINSWR